MNIIKDNQGLALFMSISMMTIILFFLSASLYLTRVDTKITANLKMATQALEVADAGLQHALALIPVGSDFNGELACGTPPCTLVPNTSFPAGSSFGYTVTAVNDPGDGGGPTSDTNNIILLASTAGGPAGATKTIEAYVRRSVGQFTPPSALYVNASSATSYDSEFFDDDDGVHIFGDDINPVNILNPNDDVAGTEASLPALTTTRDAVTDALVNELSTSTGSHLILGQGNNPSISTTSEMIDVIQLADSLANHVSTVKYLNGLTTDVSCSTPCQSCPSNNPCNFGTSASPQITYIKDSNSSSTVLNGYVRGHGILVVEGRTTIGGNFNFNGLVIHKKSDSTHYISFEDSAWVYGGVLFGSYNGNVRFTVEDYSRIKYSSLSIDMVNNNYGALFPRPARVFAWQDK